jgi:hypothetical protein
VSAHERSEESPVVSHTEVQQLVDDHNILKAYGMRRQIIGESDGPG